MKFHTGHNRASTYWLGWPKLHWLKHSLSFFSEISSNVCHPEHEPYANRISFRIFNLNYLLIQWSVLDTVCCSPFIYLSTWRRTGRTKRVCWTNRIFWYHLRTTKTFLGLLEIGISNPFLNPQLKLNCFDINQTVNGLILLNIYTPLSYKKCIIQNKTCYFQKNTLLFHR